MTQSVPLGAALGVHHVDIIVGESLGQRLDGVLEGFAVEGGDGGDVGGETVCR